jgi:alkylation response protein AidB-like acyl-CoA dehydrogenase
LKENPVGENMIGLHLIFIPEEYGGLGGGAYDIYRVSEAMARIDLGVATAVLATFLGADPITVGGTPKQKKLWMGKIADQGMLVAYGSFGLGGGWAALEHAIRYSQTRVQGGALLSTKQAYTHKLLVPNAVRLEAARTYIEWVAERIDGGAPEQQTAGAVAKYLATEAGNKAAEDAIQAHGGYGYTKEYMVEKIKRDVRITCIYEGASEILEWTIARDRWQLHLKSQGGYYRDWAAKLDQIQAQHPDSGAGAAALAALLERCRLDRLTRNQHILFRLGELIAFAETAAIFAERASTKPTEAIKLDQTTQKAMARIHARDAALKVATDGLRWAIGAGQTDPNFVGSLNLPAIYAAQVGLIEDMNFVAGKLVASWTTRRRCVWRSPSTPTPCRPSRRFSSCPPMFAPIF